MAIEGGALSFNMNSKSLKAFWKRRKFFGGPIWLSHNKDALNALGFK